MKNKLLPQSRFPWLLAFSAIFIALCAACFSVYGIATLFAGATISVIIMGTSLEIGKLTGVTFLYRYWGKTKMYLRVYLSIATVMLMIITSMGIFGYLSSAYQKSSIEYSVTQDKIKVTEQQIVLSQRSIDTLIALRTSQNTNQMNEFVVRNPTLFRQVNEQIAETDKSIKEESKKKDDLIVSVTSLKLGTAEKKDVQTFKFVADALGLPLDTVARWFILMIIFVFDPLAIGLILAYNIAVYRKEDESVYDTPTPIESALEPPKETIADEAEPPKEIIIDEVEQPKEIIIDKVEPNVEEVKETPQDEKSSLTDWFKQMYKF